MGNTRCGMYIVEQFFISKGQRIHSDLTYPVPTPSAVVFTGTNLQ